MSKRSSAKHKLDRRMGENIWGRPKSPVNKREYGPGQHGQRRKGKMSDFGIQLRAKQKLKGYYGDVTEKQFKACYTEAARMKGDTSQNLIGLARTAARHDRLSREVRADRSSPRASWSATAMSASTGSSATSPRVACFVGVRRSRCRGKAQEMALVLEAQQPRRARDPRVCRARRCTAKATFTRVPTLDEVPYPVKMEPNLVVEFYSPLRWCCSPAAAKHRVSGSALVPRSSEPTRRRGFAATVRTICTQVKGGSCRLPPALPDIGIRRCPGAARSRRPISLSISARTLLVV